MLAFQCLSCLVACLFVQDEGRTESPLLPTNTASEQLCICICLCMCLCVPFPISWGPRTAQLSTACTRLWKNCRTNLGRKRSRRNSEVFRLFRFSKKAARHGVQRHTHTARSVWPLSGKGTAARVGPRLRLELDLPKNRHQTKADDSRPEISRPFSPNQSISRPFSPKVVLQKDLPGALPAFGGLAYAPGAKRMDEATRARQVESGKRSPGLLLCPAEKRELTLGDLVATRFRIISLRVAKLAVAQ